ncbi:MAG: N-acetylmuramoyl-L-alanine amidase [Candidatus Zixiibacteriota bacterium]
MTRCLRQQFRTAILALLLLWPLSGSAREVRVAISGGAETIDAFEQEQITYFSFSELVDVLGGTLDWQVVGHKISYRFDTLRFEFLLGSPFFKLNDSVFNMTYSAVFREGKLYLPAETFISFMDQSFPQKITWDPNAHMLRVDSEYFNVTDLAVSAKANGLLIELFLANTLAYDIFVTEGNWLNISIRDGLLNAGKILARRDRRYMYDLKCHQAAGSGQVSIRLRRTIDKWHHKLVNDPPRIQISIPDVNFELDTSAEERTIGPDNKIDVIVIDPGHGGSDYGAIGPRGTREKIVVLDIAKRLAKLIRKDKQFKVVMTRDRDKTVTLQQRAEIANNAGADMFISIHANASVKRHVRGWNVFFLAPAKNDSARAVAQFENSFFLRERSAFEAHQTGQDEDEPFDPVLSIVNEMIMTEFQEESHDFAMMCDREFRRSLKIPARGVDQAGFFVLNMVFTPSVLIETGFISNKDEEKILDSGQYQQRAAKAIYEAIKRFKAKYED